MKKNKESVFMVFGVIIFLATIIIMWLTHEQVNFMMDDLWYQTRLFDETPIQNFTDIISAQIWHYNNWGGRSMTHGLLQIILLSGETWANILNVAVTILSGVIINSISKSFAPSGKSSVGRQLISISLVIGALHGLNANWEMSMYWQSGAANYLYITIFIIVFIWCYLREIPFADTERDSSKLKGITFWIIPLALVAGWSNENMGPTAFLISLATIIFLKRKHHKIHTWMIEGSIFSLVGSIICIVAPGNFVRSEQIIENTYGILWQLYLRSYRVCKGLFDYLFPSLLITSALLIIITICYKESVDYKYDLFFCRLCS